MAVTSVHNVSVLDSSFLRESQSEAVRRWGDDGRASNQTSSHLKIQRELEDEHVVSHVQARVTDRLVQCQSDGSSTDLLRVDASDSHSNGQSGSLEGGSAGESEYGQWSPGPIGSENGQEDSSDLGGVERERVRQIFREWMSTGARECTSSISRRNNGSRAEWLGETEQERVRIIREWVQMNTQQRGACVDRREEQGSEVAGQIEQVLDGLAVNHNDGQAENTRRGIRRLCGRQALLDMLKKDERERQSELQGLSEHHAVTQFAHRNRIQSLLRGRFLRNDRIIEDERPTSPAASELGLLRQRHTVSDLREGFFSRLDHSVYGQVSNVSDTSSNTDMNGNRSEQIEANNSQQVIDGFYVQTESNTEEIGSLGLLDGRTDIEDNIIDETSGQNFAAHSVEGPRQVSDSDVGGRQQLANVAFVERRDGNREEASDHRWGGTNNESSQETVGSEAEEDMQLLSMTEVFSQQSEADRGESAIPLLSNHLIDLEATANESVNWQESAAPLEQWQNQLLENEGQHSFEASRTSGEWGDGIQDNIDGHQHETAANEWSENEDREGASEVWHEDDGFQEVVHSWLTEPSDQEAAPVGRMDPFYFPDDDNVYSMELRELLSRRSVSTLLRSGFRESLDQLIRSYVERQSHAPLEWELQTAPTPASTEQDLEQQTVDQNESEGNIVQSPSLDLPSRPIRPAEQLWDQESRHYTWPQHDMHPRFGIEWDIVSDLRIDMARLQQRMNNMQRMLEACMDMQLELQRSIQQEVSAALNRSAGSPGICEDSAPEDRTKWDHVRKGICCVCCDGSIDSLLYRCGHMCTCSKCAHELVQSGEKCPMCRAPVIEVIRAYAVL
uniref:RING-type domain-containing protein n=1 Tax=Populus davidiana TaxID=266767 RepID=A0A6M2ERZ2_9ROSI